MKILKYIVIILVAGGLHSCDDYVDITPRGNAIAQSLDDIDLLLNNATSFGGDGLAQAFRYEIPIVVNDNIEMRAQDISSIESGFSAALARIYRLEPVFYSTQENDELWRETYKKIGTMNYVLQLLEDLNEDSEDKDHFKGEALTRRAFYYFLLVNVYGQHYGLPNASESGSGVPIVTVYGDENVAIDRKSVDEVYIFILNDLQEALSLLRDNRRNGSRINKPAAHGLLARVHLHMGDYDEALDNADLALTFNSNLMNYATFPADFFGNIAPPNGLDNPEHILLGEARVTSAFTESFSRVVFGRFSPELAALYDQANDLRIKVPGTDFVDGSYVYGLFNSFSLQHAVGITVPELMLIRAEVFARSGDITGALDELNALRANRFDADFVVTDGHLLTASDQAEALAHVIDERRREFHVNGMRFFDIKRLNALDNAGISLTRGSVTYSPNGANWAVPLSPNVINNSNGQISQNPRE
ncbi:RagB/SusD family nutrient uptake outer membrane protein [Seonamhaeicola sp.]|uniref:RagB/SusD family nutrient uptake outer membrane protein n=1 Tax=Seonamhaeicola sp. TaxID=1912245 RepID=UPI00260A100F|nr:RagB/SusD family nutrient uptake outer membrane protein [Seonamhaeicola sp.]